MVRARLPLFPSPLAVPISRQLGMPRRTPVRNIEATKPSFTMS